jgi:hypothetical protein
MGTSHIPFSLQKRIKKEGNGSTLNKKRLKESEEAYETS